MSVENKYRPSEIFLKEAGFEKDAVGSWEFQNEDLSPFSISYYADKNFFDLNCEVYDTELFIQSDNDLLNFIKIISKNN